MATNWGILATGRIAHKFADALKLSDTGKLVAVGSRTLDSASKFAAAWGDPTAHGSYQELIDDPNVDAIYVSTPHPQHAEWTIKTLNAGKAVLCEKPLGLNHPEVMAMVDAAQENQCFLMEAFMYRCHPQTLKLAELIQEGVVGDIRHIHATFGFHAPFNPEGRLFASELAGGGIMDVGCYPISLTRLIAGSEPIALHASGVLAETGVDLYSAALLTFENGISAHVATGVGQQLDNTVKVFGTKGQIRVQQPWIGSTDWQFDLLVGNEVTDVSGTSKNPYVCEIDEVDRCLTVGILESPRMNWEDSLGNSFTLDRWRDETGVIYPQERPTSLSGPIHGNSLSSSNRIEHINLEDVNTSVSRIVMGCDNQPNLPHASIMFDAFFEMGGNLFDTAYIYGGGRMETFLGQWIASRGVRDSVAIIGKGAHTPLNFPEHIGPQLNQSLERLQTDHLDLYFLHRDNEDIPVEEWIDALNEVADAGLVSIFGGSNWSLERIREANAYAKASKKAGFKAVSNQFSLAKMLSPVWAGCVSANDNEYRKFLQQENLLLCPWSSQARGFFTERFDGIYERGASKIDRRSWSHPPDAEMERCWFSEENFERRRRAVELASEKGVETINIALAYVLAQEFTTLPLIGPRYLSELRSSVQSLDISLANNELDWLELKSEER